MTDAVLARSPRPSLRDVAVSAEVAVSTVSRYLSGQLTVKPETEARIVAAMQSLGYVRSARDAAPRANRHGTIGLIVPQVGHDYFGRIADHVVASAEAQGYPVLIASTLSHSRKQLEYVELLVADSEICGLIYSGNYASNTALSAMIELGTPVVVIDEALTGAPPADTVLVDDYAGAYQAVAHLISLGHRRIALVTGPTSLNSVHERTRGYNDALAKAGLDPDDQVRLSGPFSEEFGVGSIYRLVAAPDPPTAVFAASDTIAVGMMVGARTSGIVIPDQLSIVGFDDSPSAAHVTPRLTTVRTPVDIMAATAVTALIERMEHPEREIQTVATPVSLIIGESTAPPPLS